MSRSEESDRSGSFRNPIQGTGSALKASPHSSRSLSLLFVTAFPNPYFSIVLILIHTHQHHAHLRPSPISIPFSLSLICSYPHKPPSPTEFPETRNPLNPPKPQYTTVKHAQLATSTPLLVSSSPSTTPSQSKAEDRRAWV